MNGLTTRLPATGALLAFIAGSAGFGAPLDPIERLEHFIENDPSSPLKPMVTKTLPILENHLRVAEHVAGKIGVSSEEGLSTPEHPDKMGT